MNIYNVSQTSVLIYQMAVLFRDHFESMDGLQHFIYIYIQDHNHKKNGYFTYLI